MSIKTTLNPMGRQHPRLPIGWTELEYLESTGTQYIDTGIYGTERHGAELKYQFPRLDGSSTRLFGGRPAADGVDSVIVVGTVSAKAESSTYLYLSSHQGVIFTSSSNPKLPCDTNIHTAKANLFGDMKFTIDGISGSGQPSGKSFTNTFTLNIFRYFTNGAYSEGAHGRVYHCKITEDARLVRNFIPALDPTGRPCMFDLVQRKPYYNQGTGEFRWRDKLPEGYTAVEYLESTGIAGSVGQYIDTGVIPDDATGMLIVDSITTDNQDYAVGCRDNETRFYVHSQTGITLRYGRNTQINTAYSVSPFNSIVTIQYNYRNDRKFVYNDNVVFSNIATLGSSAAHITLFGFDRRNVPGDADYVFKVSCRLYMAVISQGINIIHNFIPALDPTGRPCMFDLVTRKPFYNQGTGEFLYA